MHLYGRSAATVIYTTVPAEIGDITVEVSATGTLQPLTQVDISSELSGVVRSVAVDENQRVKKGDVLAELDTVRLAAQIERAEASAKAAEAKVSRGHARRSRKPSRRSPARRQLSKRGMATDQALETAHRRARPRRGQRRHRRSQSRHRRCRTEAAAGRPRRRARIYAPIDGIVLTRSVNPGQTVASSMQAPVLFVIAADLENMELKAAIDEADIGGVRPGQTGALHGRRLSGAHVRRRDPRHRLCLGHHRRRRHLRRPPRRRQRRAAAAARHDRDRRRRHRQANGVVTVPAAAFRFSPPAAASAAASACATCSCRACAWAARRAPAAAPATDGTRTLYVLRDGAPEAVHGQDRRRPTAR